MQFNFPDQDILNRIFEDKVRYFDEIWNFIIPHDRNIAKAKIVHLAGLHPWFSKSLPKGWGWWAIADKTFFAEDIRKELATPAIRMKYLEEIEKRYFEICSSTCWRATAFVRFIASAIVWIKHLLRKKH